MSRPAPWVSATAVQARVELRLTMRRGENVLALIGIPVAVLVFAGTLVPGGDPVDALLPGILAIALLANGLVNLGIATAYERGYGVLKRLGGSPLGRSGLVGAKLAVVLVVGLAQVGLLLAVAALMGWRPGPDVSVVLLVATTILGSATFAGLGLLIAGTLRPEATLVVANVLFLLGIAFGGALVAMGDLPGPVATVVGILPLGAAADAFRAALGSDADVVRPFGILVAWAVGGVIAAARTFRWD